MQVVNSLFRAQGTRRLVAANVVLRLFLNVMHTACMQSLMQFYVITFYILFRGGGGVFCSIRR